jgi:hypothetical protein
MVRGFLRFPKAFFVFIKGLDIGVTEKTPKFVGLDKRMDDPCLVRGAADVEKKFWFHI